MRSLGGGKGLWSDSTGVLLAEATDLQQLDAIRLLFREYAEALNVDLCFQQFETELHRLPWDYAAPRGCLFLATVAGELAGCCALRPLDGVDHADACEMKRLYVRPAFRGLGLGRRLVEATLDRARQSDYACVLLDTLNEMESARALYDDLGFIEIPPYYFNPIAGAHYLKAVL
jgi:ribosomal protein S18 acetylase RimI-like enzyme